MKAKNLFDFSSSPAPKEWREIPEIKAQYPKECNCEKSLQKIKGLNICIWMISYGGIWKPSSDFFYIKK
jgi:hypothetical protein